MPLFCSNCGKKETRNRSIDGVSKICGVCSGSASSGEVAATGAAAAVLDPVLPPSCDVDEEETLANVKFGCLKKWLNETLAYHVAQMDDRLTKEIGAVKEDLQATKAALEDTNSEITKVKKDLAEAKRSNQENVTGLENRVKNLEADTKLSLIHI